MRHPMVVSLGSTLVLAALTAVLPARRPSSVRVEACRINMKTSGILPD